MGNLKPVAPLTDAQVKEVAELQQKAAGIRKIQADAQTELAAAQLTYSVAMDKFKLENEPALNDAKAKNDDINNKCGFELTTIEESLRNVRTVELAALEK